LIFEKKGNQREVRKKKVQHDRSRPKNARKYNQNGSRKKGSHVFLYQEKSLMKKKIQS